MFQKINVKLVYLSKELKIVDTVDKWLGLKNVGKVLKWAKK
jgi:hypothetical protein